MSSVVAEFGDLEEAETLDAGSSGSATVVDSVALEPGDTVVVVDGGLVTMADAPALAVVDVGTVALVTALVVVVLAFVIVVVGFTVVVVGLTVVVVRLHRGGGRLHRGGGGLHRGGGGLHRGGGGRYVASGICRGPPADCTYYPDWRSPALHIPRRLSPITTASAHVMPNARSNERKGLFLILKPPLSHTAAPFGRGRYLFLAWRLYRSKLIRAIM